MGQKVHPIGFRIGVIRDWQSKWYSDKRSTYTELVHEDVKIRRRIEGMRDAGISGVEIDRNANQISVTIRTSRPGIVIGRQGKNVEDLRKELEKLTSKKVRVNIVEINVPELDAKLVARSVADQLERRVAHRRAMKQTAQRTMQRGAKGIRIMVGGRLGGSEMSRKDKEMQGQVPLHTLRADIDYGTAEARTTFGQIGVKCWIYKGEILPERASAAASAEATAEGPAPAIAPESVRGPEREGPAPSAEALAEATGQPRRRAVAPAAQPGGESLGTGARTETEGGVLTEAEAQSGSSVQLSDEREGSPGGAADAAAHEDRAIEKVEAVADESGSEAGQAAGDAVSVETQTSDVAGESTSPEAEALVEEATEAGTSPAGALPPDADAPPSDEARPNIKEDEA
ncbi:MAG: 30S ribosomal protein S3 [Dehalococcoidia bacterium]|nr:30S ribosomal protein S3 [Dehalococcoidia bacterium]